MQTVCAPRGTNNLRSALCAQNHAQEYQLHVMSPKSDPFEVNFNLKKFHAEVLQTSTFAYVSTDCDL